jgi:DNA-binding GntR family transcriptional regulator
VVVRRIKREPAITQTVVAEIRRAILSGALTPGSRVTQEELAEQMGVSRAPVRQALLLLERERLVESDRWRGATVTRVDPVMIREVYQFRGEIERFVASTLANRHDFEPSSLRTIVSAGAAAASSGDVPQLIEMDWRFHTGLYDAVGNKVLVEVMRNQWTHIRRVMGATLAMSDYRQQVWDQHAGILDAIVAHDADYAGMLARRHTSEASAALLKRLERSNQEIAGTQKIDHLATPERALRPRRARKK